MRIMILDTFKDRIPTETRVKLSDATVALWHSIQCHISEHGQSDRLDASLPPGIKMSALRIEMIPLRSPHRILPFYFIENLLLHPDNIASLKVPGFDAAKWREAIHAVKNIRPLREAKHARGRIRELRSVPEFQKVRAWDADANEIYDAYASADFETFYPVVPMKDVPRT